MTYVGAPYYQFSWVPPKLTPQGKVVVGAEVVRLGPARVASALYDQVGWGYGHRERKDEARSFTMEAAFASAERMKLADGGKPEKRVGQGTEAFWGWFAIGAAVWIGVMWLLFTIPRENSPGRFVFVLLFLGPACFGFTCLSKLAVHMAIDKWVRELVEAYEKAKAAGELPAWQAAVKAKPVRTAEAPIFPYRPDPAKTRTFVPTEPPAGSVARTTGQSTGVRGKITIPEDSRATITLTADADASTFMHETAHHWLEQLLTDAEHPLAPDVLKADADTVRKWLGAKSNEDIIYKGANEKRRTAATERHEKFARGFERYLMEGNGPSPALAPVFAQYKQWLTDIYQTVDHLNAPINNDIRGVFDRLLSVAPQPVPTNHPTRPSRQTIKRAPP